MDQFLNALGVTGAVFYVLSYGALQTGFLKAETYRYSILNLIASGFVLISLAGAFNWGSFYTNAFWVILSFVGMIRLWLLTRNRERSELDKAFTLARLQGFTEPNISRVWQAGIWRDMAAGEVIATEGEPIGRLYFLASGRAEVLLGGHPIAEIEPMSYIGEQTCLSGDAATATVRLTEASTVFDIDAVQLRNLADRNADFRSDLQRSIALDSMQKITSSNVQKMQKPVAADSVSA